MIDIQANLPALIVVIPLLGGVLATFTGRGILPWAWASLVTGATFALTLRMMATLLQSGAPYISYELGNWPRWWGIEYRVDLLNAFILLVVAGVGFITTLYARESVNDEIAKDRHHVFYAVWILAITGLLGITITGDAFNVYVLLEISSLTVYALIAMGKDRDRRALTASLRYLILGSVGASFILLGIGYLMMVTGTLNMEDMHNQLMRLANLDTNRTVLVAFAFLLVGLSIKMALYPLHMWLPKAYTYAPSAVSALLAATATKVGVYMAFRFLFGIFGVGFSFYAMPSHLILLAMASLGIVFSSLAAIRQNNAKSLLAYSSVGQIGYIVAGFSLANPDGVAGSIVHIFNHAVTKGGMFLALGAVAYRVGGTDISHLRGLAKRMPLTCGALALGGLGLIGMPLTAGFISKWYLVKGAMGSGMWGLVVVVLFGSLLALVYVWKLIEAMYFGEPTGRSAEAKEAPLSMLIPIWILVALSIYFGVDATFTGETATRAAAGLLGGTP
ncbi:MAG: monovalent cation/H+ antiporter subunit D family protein [Myxococcales bacterium]|nr:monovalent cation/H+ antiporter subunit D family protein [Myxococcales bacterium]